MKRDFLLKAATLCFCSLAVTFTSCSNDDDENPEPVIDPVLPDTDLVTFEGDYYSALIDKQQTEGPLLYPTDGSVYGWRDEATTLNSRVNDSEFGAAFWNGGIAISNYVNSDLENHNDYIYQLEVPKSNGSSNFAIVFCDAFMALDSPKTIKAMDVCNTTYCLGVMKYGNAYASALTEKGTYFTLTIRGTNKGKEAGTVTVDLARDGVFIEDWTTVSLQPLGDVDSIFFSVDGSDVGDWGLNTPTYVAIDNIEIKR